MKERGRGERYKRVREGEKMQYQWVGEEERRGGKERKRKETRSGVEERMEGRRVWPTLGEGYMMKDRHKTGLDQYKRAYTEGRNEAKRRKRYVGRKRVLVSMNRPRKLSGRKKYKGMAMQQDHRMGWDRVEIQRRREYRKGMDRDSGGEEKKNRKEQVGRKRRRRKRERARNRYEYSKRRREEKAVMLEREEAIRNRKAGGNKGMKALWGRDTEREERVGGREEEGEGTQRTAMHKKVRKSRAELESKSEEGWRPSKAMEKSDADADQEQGGRKRVVGKVESEGRNYRYGEECGKYRQMYTKEVGKREEIRKHGEWRQQSKGKVRKRREVGKRTYIGEKRKGRKRNGAGYTSLGEEYGRRVREDGRREESEDRRVGRSRQERENGKKCKSTWWSRGYETLVQGTKMEICSYASEAEPLSQMVEDVEKQRRERGKKLDRVEADEEDKEDEEHEEDKEDEEHVAFLADGENDGIDLEDEREDEEEDEDQDEEEGGSTANVRRSSKRYARQGEEDLERRSTEGRGEVERKERAEEWIRKENRVNKMQESVSGVWLRKEKRKAWGSKQTVDNVGGVRDAGKTAAKREEQWFRMDGEMERAVSRSGWVSKGQEREGKRMERERKIRRRGLRSK